MHGFSFHIFDDEIEVQDVISPFSLDQILISSIPWMRKCIKNTRSQMAYEMGVWTVRISQNFKGPFFRCEEQLFKDRILGVTVDLTNASRSMVAMRRPLVNRCFCLMTIRSRMKGRDVISSREEGGA